MTSLSANALMTPVQLCLVRAGLPDPFGALRWAIGSWSPAIIFIAGDQVSFLIFSRGRDTSRPARMREKSRKFWKKI